MALGETAQLRWCQPLAHAYTCLNDGKTAVALNALSEAFKTCAGPNDLRRFVMQAKTDTELEAVRDLPAFRSTVAKYSDRVALR